MSVNLKRIRPQTPVIKALGCFMEANCKIFVMIEGVQGQCKAKCNHSGH